MADGQDGFLTVPARRVTLALLLTLALGCTDSPGVPADPTVSPEASATPAVGVPSEPPGIPVLGPGPHVTYRTRAGALVLSAPSTPGVRPVVQNSPCRGNATLEWSPGGDHLACLTREPAGEGLMTLLDAGGRVLLEASSVGDFSWSPDGRYVAYWGRVAGHGTRYRIATGEGRVLSEWIEPEPGGDRVLPRAIWSPAGLKLAITDRGTAPPSLPPGVTVTRVPGYPLAWALQGSAVITAAGFDSGCQPRGCFEAVLFSADGGGGAPASIRLPQLDNGIDFWPSPDGRVVAFPRHDGTDVGLALLELPDGAVRQIEGSRIGYPGEGIPGSHVAWTPGGDAIYWLNPGQRGEPAGIFRATGGGEARHLWDPRSLRAWFSPEVTWVAYLDIARAQPGSIPLRVAQVDGSQDRELPDFGGGNVAWRP